MSGAAAPTCCQAGICSYTVSDNNNNEKLYNQYYEILSKMNNDLKVNVEKSYKQSKNWIEDDKIAQTY